MLIAAKHIQIGDLICTEEFQQIQPDNTIKRYGPLVEGIVEAANNRYVVKVICFVIAGQGAAFYREDEFVEVLKKGHAIIEIVEECRAVVFNHGCGCWYPLYRMSSLWRWDVCRSNEIAEEIKRCDSREEAIRFVSQYKR